MSGKIYKINKANNIYPKNKYVHAYYEKESIEPKITQPAAPPSYLEILKRPDLLDLERPEEDIYQLFKTIEKGLKNELENISDKTALMKSNDLSKLMRIFIVSGETLCTKSIKMAIEKQIDRRMWVIFKLDIEKRVKIEILNEEPELFDNKINFINKILKKFIEMMPEINNSDISINNQERRLFSSFFNFLGEVVEFKDKFENSGKIRSPDKIIQNYLRAINFYPYEGKYFMLIASCSLSNNDNLSAIYWSIRSLMAELPFDTKENLQEFFEKARKNYESVMKDKNDFAEVNIKDGLKLFLMAFLRYLYIFFTKISFEKIGEVSANMMDFLSKYISYLKNEPNIDKSKESSVLNYIIQMIIFSLYYTIEGFDIEDKTPEKKLQKTVEQMESNVIYVECLKFSFCMLYQIYSLLLQDECESYLNLFLPILYYFVSFKNIQRFFFEKFPNFKQMMIKINDKLKLRFNTLENSKNTKKNGEEEKKTDSFSEENKNEQLTEIIENCLISSIDKNLVGFIPLKKFFIENKKSYKIYSKDNQYQLKLFLALQILEKIGCNFENLEENSKNLAEKVDFEFPIMDDFKNMDLSNLTAEDFQDKSKTLIVVDGQNVALRHKEDQFSSKALKMVAEYWMKKGYPIHILLPDICFSKETVLKKRELAKQKNTSTKNLPDDIEILLDLKKRGFASGIPNWTYDDSFIIDYAKKKKAYILTNDRYRDHIENYSQNDPKLKEKLRNWIKDNCIK